MTTRLLRRLLSVIPAALLCAHFAVAAQDGRYQVRSGPFEISVSVASPAAVRGGHAKDHPEQTMHGGKPLPGEKHLLATIRDARTGEPVTDAEVVARLVGPGGFSLQKPLEAMTIANAPGYGNYFAFPDTGGLAIELEIRPARATAPVRVRLELRH